MRALKSQKKRRSEDEIKIVKLIKSSYTLNESGCSALDIEEHRHKEHTSHHEGDECEETELLEQSLLFDCHCKFIGLL